MTITEFKQYQSKMRTKVRPGNGWKGIYKRKGAGIS